MAGLSRAQIEAKLRAAQREAERKYKAEVDRVNRENKRRVDEHNRRAAQHNQQVVQAQQRRVDAYNAEVARVNSHNQRVNTNNQRVNDRNRAMVAEINRQLRSVATTGPRYTSSELELVDRLQERAAEHPEREYDAFLSYARIDGGEVGIALREELDQLGASVWFDEVAITPGKSQALQMDKGLRSARCGIALLTPAYLTGRFWTERELGALLHKETLIPVLHNVTFAQVAEYSGILPDLAGFETARDSVQDIAAKIAAAILPTS
ncbi:toll/interleukin-1 receptor domain-containing protein [Microbacterium sp. A8/3-1]|uniref:Toll/interleukin-1 receptor domain-containing protein n=1 Tax=Microbacterium sp. A8/3-1 TaxID=3160749 RepID=A0AAU7W0Z3_9MICO